MRVSLDWLKEYVDIPLAPEELARCLTMLGLEIEAVERPGADISKVVTGKILSIDPHPDADKLVVCKTDIGQGEPLQIVCGAKNMNAGDIVPTVLVGGTLVGGFEIGRRKMRGVESFGMMCSARELGLGEDHSGLLILDADTPVGQDALPILGLDDVIFDIEITPNRGDWACMIGVARELAAYFGRSLRLPGITTQETEPAAAALSSVILENEELCPRYIGRVLTEVQIGPSPPWLCQRLIAAGLRPINNVVDITNFVLMETGHPLHAFDYDRLAENRIVVRTAKPGETITTIDGEVRKLDPEMLIIADAAHPVAVAGVMGGLESEVGEKTTRVFLESAYFKPASVRRTARALGMQTEASAHFQRGADPEMALYAINRAAALMQQLAGARVAEGLLDVYPRKLVPNKVTLRYNRSDCLLGTEIPAPKQRDIVEKLGFTVLESSKDACTVRVPPWRHDVAWETDLIEEVARFFGYDNLGASLPAVRQNAQVFAPDDAPTRALRRFLVGCGLTEFFNWTFCCAEDVEHCALEDEYLDMVALANPLSERQATLRPALIPGLMANVSRNVRHGSPDIMAFELGPVFFPMPGQDLPKQCLRLGIVLSGACGRKHWSRPLEPLDFYDLKGYCEAVLDFFGAAGTFEAASSSTFQAGQCGQIKVEKRVLGHLGQVSGKVLKAYDLEQPVYLCELDVDRLLRLERAPTPFKAVPAYPPSLRDMAVVVPAEVPAGALRDAALRAGGKLLKAVDIFDLYTGKQVPAGKKSIALSLVFQSDERTLTEKDTQKAWDKILRKLQHTFEAELR